MKYASLTGPLIGVYVALPFEHEGKNRTALNTSGLKRLWCSIYDEVEVDELIARFGGVRLPLRSAMNLDYDSNIVEQEWPNES